MWVVAVSTIQYQVFALRDLCELLGVINKTSTRHHLAALVLSVTFAASLTAAVYHHTHSLWIFNVQAAGTVTGLALNAGLMAIGTRILGLHYLLAQLIATCMVLVFNFVASRYWTFARNRLMGDAS